MEQSQTIHFQSCTWSELTDVDRSLLSAAIAAADSAYAPYSQFHVGAAVLLDDGTVVTGSNQENIAYPSGLCAERTALFAASAQHPGREVIALAVVARNQQNELSPAMPCGACRQVMAEQQNRQKRSMRTICFVSNEKILIFEGMDALLPFSFSI